MALTGLPLSLTAKDLAEHRSGYWAAFRQRGGEVAEEHPWVLYRRGLFDMAAVMLIGVVAIAELLAAATDAT